MQSDNQPVRPPRVTRSIAKESSTGLLMSVIRSLTASRDIVERDREKINLEREFRESDHRLDKLILNHHSDLTSVMQAFSKISTRLTSNREKIKTVKEKLINSKKLLHCKRDELKKLWLESIENKNVLELLDHIDNMARVPSEVVQLINKKHYLHATKLLVESIGQLDGYLKSVESLREVRVDLTAKKEEMFEILVDELHKHIYVKSTADIVKRFKRQGSERRRNLNNPEGTPVRKVSVADILSPALMQSSALPKRKSPNWASQMDLTGDQPIEENSTLADPEDDSHYFITILIECLSILNKIPDAIESIKDRTYKELVNIVRRTARELVADTSSASNSTTVQAAALSNGPIPSVLRSVLLMSSDTNKAHLLRDLLDLVFQQFRGIVQMHESCVIVNLRRVENQRSSHGGEALQIYSMTDIWSKIQAVLQLIADFYMDISGSNMSDKTHDVNNASNAGPSPTDLSSYFLKKKIGLSVGGGFGKTKRTPLFRFDLSSHAMSLNAYLQEQKEATTEKGEDNELGNDSTDAIVNNDAEQYHSDKDPAPENIVIMFNALMKFVAENEEELNLEVGNNFLQLHAN